MKKSILLVAGLASLGMLASCGSNSGAEKVSLGLGYSASYAVESHGKVANEFDVSAAAVIFDKDGKVVEAKLDTVQVKGKAVVGETETTYEINGKVVDGDILSKQELGKDYGMVAYGGSIAEVDAEINAFAAWCKGKTVDQIKAVKEGDVTGCTITVDSYVASIESAFAHKRAAVDYAKGSKVGLGMKATFGKTYSGGLESSVAINGALVSSDKKVVASWSDDVVATFKAADGEGKIALNNDKYCPEGTFISKYDLKEAYNMKGSSDIKAEWYTQAESFDAAVVGKSAEEIVALDLATSGVTITANGFIGAVSESLDYAHKAHIGPQAK